MMTAILLSAMLFGMNDIGVIHLTNGGYAIVDADMHASLNQVNWQRSSGGRAYRCATVGGVASTVMMHRVINNTPPDMDTDHINRWPLDNRRSNLRTATHAQNLSNQGKRAGDHSSQYKGVHWCKTTQRWIARLHHLGRVQHIGVFTNDAEAAMAYNVVAERVFGEFARKNEVHLG